MNELDNQPTLKDRILLMIGKLEDIPDKIESVFKKQEKQDEEINAIKLNISSTDNNIKNLESYLRNEVKNIKSKLIKTCVSGNDCALELKINKDKIFEQVKANTTYREEKNKNKLYWKDKLIGMIIALLLVYFGTILKNLI